MILAVAVALACGGPYMMSLDIPLLDPSTQLGDVLLDAEEHGPYPEDVSRFLHASEGVAPDVYGALKQSWYGNEAAPSEAVSLKMLEMRTALARGDRKAAVVAASAVVEAILDLPAPMAGPHQEDLQLAVELIEVQDQLAGVTGATLNAWFADRHAPVMRLPAGMAPVAAARLWLDGDRKGAPDARSPRIASMRWALLNDAMRTRIPDGWSAADIRTQGTADFVGLHAEVDDWLRRYPDHPLADYARLRKLRLHHLAGEVDAGWAVLFEMLPRHPHRVANEMRFLLQTGDVPTRAELRTLPPEIAAGLMEHVAFTRTDWDDVWTRAAASPGRTRIEERLFYVWIATASGKLPDRFPATADHPTPVWARLRTTILLRNGRISQAEAQLADSPPAPAIAAPARARIALARGDWLTAVRTPELDPATVLYLLRVLAPVETLRALADDADPGLHLEARIALASRAVASSRDWAGAAKLLDPVDPVRATRLREVARLDKDRSAAGRLALARHLRAKGGELFIGNSYDDMVWYRSLPRYRPPTAEWRADRDVIALTHAQEWTATADFLQRNFATWYALLAYAEWAAMLDVPRLNVVRLTEARAVLAEADMTYNVLLNYGSGDHWAWGSILPQSAPAQAIRKAGAALRARK